MCPVPHGTTVLGLQVRRRHRGRGRPSRHLRATSIADPKMRKVFAADAHSAIAIAGAAGQAIEMVKLFQLELEHYEKITGDRLSLEGKANRLAQMIRSNFPMALQGSSSCRCSAASTTRRDGGPDLLLRRHGRPLGGGRLPDHRLGRPAREELAQEAVAAGADARRGAPRGRRGVDRRGRGRRRHGRSRREPRDLAGRDDRHGRRRRGRARRPTSRPRSRRSWPSGARR